MRLDVGDLRVEGRPMVHEVNAGGRGLVAQHEPGMLRAGRCANWSAIQSGHKADGGKERNGDYSTPKGRGLEHGRDYSVGASMRRYAPCLYSCVVSL